LTKILDDAGLNLLFRDARTHRVWQDRDVSDVMLQAVYDLAKMGPTSMNCSPMRIVFVKSEAAKDRLKPALSPGNVEKTMAAPVTAIIAQDMAFYERLPELAPHTDGRSVFAGKAKLIEETAFRNASMQGAYVLFAARALGLDCGPMSGFNKSKVDEEFFPGQSVRSNFLLNIGYGDVSALHPRQPRLDFDTACRVL
jgi:3-hydroxypropanoate dehydrogenase